MCGLIYNASCKEWPLLINKNLERAGVNKGVITFTAVTKNVSARGYAYIHAGATEVVEDFESLVAPGVLHMQAPTSEHSQPHPAIYGKTRVWHNGILKQSTIDAWKDAAKSEWDTKIIASIVSSGMFEKLSELDGSFACLAFIEPWRKFIAFRNNLSPLFTDGFSMSSVQIYNHWKPIDPGVVYELSSVSGQWEPTVINFSTPGNPYEGL